MSVFAACFCLHLCVTSARVACVRASLQRATASHSLSHPFPWLPEAPRPAPRTRAPQASRCSPPVMDPFSATVWPQSWHRARTAYVDAPWRTGPHAPPEHLQQRFARQWPGPQGWLARAAERLDLEHKSGTLLATRPAPEDPNQRQLFEQRRRARLEGHLAPGFVPGRHAWFILGRPTVVRPQHKQNSPLF